MSFLSFLSAAKRQIDVLDNGATAENPNGNGQKKSVAKQIKDAGVGFVKGAVLPVYHTVNTYSPAAQSAQTEINKKLDEVTKTAQKYGAKDLATKASTMKDTISEQTLGYKQSDSTGTKVRKIAGNTASTALTFLAPAISKVVAGGVESTIGRFGLNFLTKAGTEGGLNVAGKAVAGAAEGAALGAPFNVASTVAGNEPVTGESLLKSAKTGAITGAALGGATAGGSAAFQAVREHSDANIHNILLKNNERYAKLNDSLQTATEHQKPIIASMMNDIKSQALQTGAIGKNVLMPNADTPITDPELKGYYEAKIAELKSMDGHNVSLIDTADGKQRVSDNSPVYSELYKKNGHPPTNQDYVDYIHEQTIAGKPVGYAFPGEADTYKELLSNATKGTEVTPVATTSKAVDTPVDTGTAPSTLPAGERQKGFLETAQKSDNTTLEGKTKLAELEQGYKQLSNDKVYESAKKTVAKDPYKVATDTLATTEPLSVQQSADALELLSHLQKQGDYETFIKVADHLDKSFRSHGQAAQIAALYDRMTPEGWLKTAAKKVQRAREQIGNYEYEGQTVADIRGQVEGINPADRGTVKNAVDKSIQDTIDKGLAEADGTATTGEKVAKSVDNKLNPKIKKQADTLVKEIVKKIEQEELPTPGVKVKKSPLDTLREVFSRSEEAKAAYPEAQSILYDKYANNPEMMKVLDKFFTSELKLPAAESTVNAAIAEQLKAKQTTVSKAIFESWKDQKQTVEDVTQSLIKEGFDEPSAKILAKEVTDRLNQQFADAKKATLERLSQDAPRKAQKTFLDKIEKLSNVGALDTADYLDLARAKLKLPNLTPESSARISELAQQIQDLPDGYEKFQAITKLQEEIKSNIPQTMKQKLVSVFGAPKSIMASADLSGFLRQGGVLGSRFGKEWSLAAKDAVEYLGSKEKFDKAMAEIATRKNMDLYSKAGLDLAIPGGIREEAFPSGLAEKLPGLGKVVSASDRGYTGFLTKLRADVFDRIVADLKSTGIDVASMSEKDIKSLGRFINTASGRGELGLLEKHSVSLGEALFSPRLWKSRLDMLNPLYYKNLSGPARKYALQSAASFASIAASVLSLAALAGAKVETDARSSDFLKIKVGDTRYDILGGFQQNLVFAHRFLPGSILGQKTYIGSGEKKSSTTGAITDLGSGGIGAANRLSILSDFIKSKENPVISTGANIIKGTDAAGNKINPVTEIGKLFVPLPVGDTYKSIQDTKNIPESLLKATLPTAAGIGVNTYGVKDVRPTPKQQIYLDKLKAGGASKEEVAATKLFFQTKKSAPQRAAASAKINEQIALYNSAKDPAERAKYIQKAQKIAQDYNTSYASAFTDWAKKYAGKYSSAKLNKEYKSGKIPLTNASIKSRAKTIKENTPA